MGKVVKEPDREQEEDEGMGLKERGQAVCSWRDPPLPPSFAVWLLSNCAVLK